MSVWRSFVVRPCPRSLWLWFSHQGFYPCNLAVLRTLVQPPIYRFFQTAPAAVFRCRCPSVRQHQIRHFYDVPHWCGLEWFWLGHSATPFPYFNLFCGLQSAVLTVERRQVFVSVVIMKRFVRHRRHKQHRSSIVNLELDVHRAQWSKRRFFFPYSCMDSDLPVLL